MYPHTCPPPDLSCCAPFSSSRPRHHHWSTYRGGPSGGSRTLSLGTATSSSLPPQPSSALFARKGLPINRGSTATNALPRQKRRTLPKIATASGNNSLAPQAARNAAGITNASASEKSAEGTRPSTLRKSSSTTARVTVRRAKKRDYQGVADIRGVIIPVGMSGATGFLGGKVMIDDPVEAERRKLMAKVSVVMCRPLSRFEAPAHCPTAVKALLEQFILLNFWEVSISTPQLPPPALLLPVGPNRRVFQ